MLTQLFGTIIRRRWFGAHLAEARRRRLPLRLTRRLVRLQDEYLAHLEGGREQAAIRAMRQIIFTEMSLRRAGERLSFDSAG